MFRQPSTEKRKVAGSIPALATKAYAVQRPLVLGRRTAHRRIGHEDGANMGPKRGAAIRAFSVGPTQVVEGVECGRYVVELVIEQICVRVGRDGDGRVPHSFLQQPKVGAGPAG
jgi:hypothetical protein